MADRLDEVLDAAYACLELYGARRTTMDDIARRAGMSRSAVYQYVRNKDDAFRRLAERLHEQALGAAAGAASRPGAAPRERVRGVLAAKLALLPPGGSPHTAELLDERARLFGGICEGFTARLRALLIDIFTTAGLPAPADAADVCLALARGFEAAPGTARLLPQAVEALLEGYSHTEGVPL
ncbi:TetR/AcrR family transcriptional regulator [Actinomadura parmotrematis]|uniref:TetR/AcrR family transcriptional regulator n=1 Tax=Actinomadura parmotrematis TaxID=2864039 RepID=A0ABS7FWR8_9ACTN|nr:TetR/AcrR family transcriptional regulator [Actinomadura parmotrematis]MBW8484863.1 TetR/AcrR family transcriptional regulator [Actinomadura parmotrematis]